MSENYLFGKKGEDVALKHLVKDGYEILRTNWRFKNKEIDIIAKKNNTLIFVEVKTRSNDVEHPEDIVTRSKQKFLVDAAEAYILWHDIDIEARFDVIFIYFFGNQFSVEHIEDAFYPTVN